MNAAKRSIVCAFAGILSGILLSCGTTNSIIYEHSQTGKFEVRTPGGVQKIDSIPHSVKDPAEDPFLFQVKYGGPRSVAETLLSIDVKMMASEAPGKPVAPLNCKYFASRYITQYYYYNDPSREQDPKKPLNSMIYREDRNTPSTINYYYIDMECMIKQPPDTIEQIINVKWTTGEKEFKTVLKKGEIYTAPVRSRPFG